MVGYIPEYRRLKNAIMPCRAEILAGTVSKTLNIFLSRFMYLKNPVERLFSTNEKYVVDKKRVNKLVGNGKNNLLLVKSELTEIGVCSAICSKLKKMGFKKLYLLALFHHKSYLI